ncbi:MAG: hypothetical protein LBD37_06780 [Treponema sp.]|jgi:hypothetical protein|nr:hypothetical protein [Treponema sp.]
MKSMTAAAGYYGRRLNLIKPPEGRIALFQPNSVVISLKDIPAGAKDPPPEAGERHPIQGKQDEL